MPSEAVHPIHKSRAILVKDNSPVNYSCSIRRIAQRRRNRFRSGGLQTASRLAAAHRPIRFS
jgi:hypothetical protein